MIKDLPTRLKTLRSNHGLSQKEVANQIGISPSIISAYETGERTPSTEIILALSHLFHCSTDYILGKETILPATCLDVSELTQDQIIALNNLIKTMKE